MTKTVAILATADTKGDEIDFLRGRIRAAGAEAIVIDFGVVGPSRIATDISASETAAAGGVALEALRTDRRREEASAVMSRGMIEILSERLRAGTVHGVIGLGGTQGTATASAVMRALPYGLPKVMVSTMASGNTAGYVGIRDITMMFSVSDILGLNPFLRTVLSNAAEAVAAMAKAYSRAQNASSKPVVGMTNLGVLTQGALRAIERLKGEGFEVVVFHAVGSGGAAMEAMMREGVVTAVFDYALGELADQMFGGIRAGDDARLTVAAELGLPQVVVPGGIDHIGILAETPNTVPPHYADRAHAWHNPAIFVPRTSAQEGAAIMAELARRLGPARHASIVLPLRGVSSYSVEGGPLRDPGADAALFSAAHAAFDGRIPVVDVDAGAEDPAFVDACVDVLLAHIRSAASDGARPA